MRANEVRFRPGSGTDGPLRKSGGEGQLRQPHRTVGGPHQQLDIGWKVGVEAQCCTANHDAYVIAVIASMWLPEPSREELPD